MAKATGPTFVVSFRRRKKNLTDYKKRLALIKSESPRLVVRASNHSVSVQLISFDAVGDKTIAQANSFELEKYGWMPQANTPTAYLTGMLAAKRASSAGVKDAHLDIGMATATKGRIHFAAAMGAKNAGMALEMGEGLIDEKRLNGSHIADYAKKLEAQDAQKYGRLFSRYAKKKIDPKTLPKIFEEAKGRIAKGES
jgi:large subunit ribosomal protein L18